MTVEHIFLPFLHHAADTALSTDTCFFAIGRLSHRGAARWLLAGGAMVADAAPIFVAHMVRSPLKLEVGPHDGHFTALAIDLVTQATAEAFIEL